ncbi:hypothetical protein [Larkinella ripae]
MLRDQQLKTTVYEALPVAPADIKERIGKLARIPATMVHNVTIESFPGWMGGYLVKFSANRKELLQRERMGKTPDYRVIKATPDKDNWGVIQWEHLMRVEL